MSDSEAVRADGETADGLVPGQESRSVGCPGADETWNHSSGLKAGAGLVNIFGLPSIYKNYKLLINLYNHFRGFIINVFGEY